MADPTPLSAYYADRLASIYRGKPKASATISLLVRQIIADGLALDLDPAFDLDTATGQRLDIIGKYVGAPRDVGVPDTRPYFGFVTYDYPAGDQNLHGFTSYTSLSLNSDGIFLQYEFLGKSTSQLPDYTYRQLLKLKIATNSSNNSMDAIQKQIEDFFPGQLQLRDNQDMSLDYFYGSTFQLPVSVLTSALPRPMGVRVNASKAIGFDVAVDTIPAYTSETPHPLVDWGLISSSTAKAFLLTNATESPFTVLTITADGDFSVSDIAPALTVALAQGESVGFNVTANVGEGLTLSGTLRVYLSSAAGLSVYTTQLAATKDTSVSPILFDLTDQALIDQFNADPLLAGVNLYAIMDDNSVVLAEFEPRARIGTVVDITAAIDAVVGSVKGITFTLVYGNPNPLEVGVPGYGLISDPVTDVDISAGTQTWGYYSTGLRTITGIGVTGGVSSLRASGTPFDILSGHENDDITVTSDGTLTIYNDGPVTPLIFNIHAI